MYHFVSDAQTSIVVEGTLQPDGVTVNFEFPCYCLVQAGKHCKPNGGIESFDAFDRVEEYSKQPFPHTINWQLKAYGDNPDKGRWSTEKVYHPNVQYQFTWPSFTGTDAADIDANGTFHFDLLVYNPSV